MGQSGDSRYGCLADDDSNTTLNRISIWRQGHIITRVTCQPTISDTSPCTLAQLILDPTHAAAYRSVTSWLHCLYPTVRYLSPTVRFASNMTAIHLLNPQPPPRVHFVIPTVTGHSGNR